MGGTGEDVVAEGGEVPEGVDHRLDQVVVGLQLVEDHGEDDGRVGVRHLADEPAELLHVLLGQAPHHPADVVHRGGPAEPELGTRLVDRGPPLVVEGEPLLVGEALEEGPELVGQGRLGRVQRDGRQQVVQRHIQHIAADRVVAGHHVRTQTAELGEQQRVRVEAVPAAPEPGIQQPKHIHRLARRAIRPDTGIGRLNELVDQAADLPEHSSGERKGMRDLAHHLACQANLADGNQLGQEDHLLVALHVEASQRQRHILVAEGGRRHLSGILRIGCGGLGGQRDKPRLLGGCHDRGSPPRSRRLAGLVARMQVPKDVLQVQDAVLQQPRRHQHHALEGRLARRQRRQELELEAEDAGEGPRGKAEAPQQADEQAALGSGGEGKGVQDDIEHPDRVQVEIADEGDGLLVHCRRIILRPGIQQEADELGVALGLLPHQVELLLLVVHGRVHPDLPLREEGRRLDGPGGLQQVRLQALLGHGRRGQAEPEKMAEEGGEGVALRGQAGYVLARSSTGRTVAAQVHHPEDIHQQRRQLLASRLVRAIGYGITQGDEQGLPAIRRLGKDKINSRIQKLSPC
jgi:hypothetical protein